jgi:hypothetical protein
MRDSGANVLVYIQQTIEYQREEQFTSYLYFSVAVRRGIIVLTERHNVCPFVGTGFPASECVYPLGPKGGEELTGERVRVLIGRLVRKPGTLCTLWGSRFL